MKFAVLKERRPHEARVAISPEVAKKLVAAGHTVALETGAGDRAAMTDAAYVAAGVEIAPDFSAALAGAAAVLKVQRPLMAGEDGPDELSAIPEGAVLIGALAPYASKAHLQAYAARRISAIALELLPRITRAQSMDILSSQANLAGYKAVIEAATTFGRAFPMMMTAAGTVAPARVMIFGVGVAGLQAIATARRLGAIVSATDVRPATKEQVESLAATFVAVEDEEFKQAQTAGGYAKEMSAGYKQKQAALIAETIKKQDIAICTALIPGRPAPTLISEDMVKTMKPGSVIVDLAVEQGGNCPLSEPGKVVVKHGVTLVGHLNWPSRIAVDASQLYARNILNFVTPLVDKETKALKIDPAEELIAGTLLAHAGEIVHPNFADSNSKG